MTEASARNGSAGRGGSEVLTSAAVVAGGVLAVGFAQLVARMLVSFGVFRDLQNLLIPYIASIAGEILTVSLPFAVGVLCSLWLVRPVMAGVTVFGAIGGGALAAMGGGILVFVTQLALAVVRAPSYTLMGRIPGVDPFFPFTTAANAVIENVPLVVLGAVLLWLYLRRRANTP